MKNNGLQNYNFTNKKLFMIKRKYFNKNVFKCDFKKMIMFVLLIFNRFHRAFNSFQHNLFSTFIVIPQLQNKKIIIEFGFQLSTLL